MQKSGRRKVMVAGIVGARNRVLELAGAARDLSECGKEDRRTGSGSPGKVEVCSEWRPIDNSLAMVQRSWQWSDEGQLGYWDGLIVAAVERGGCAWLLSEDFHTGRKLGGVTVINPFVNRPAEFGLAARRG
jgi:hypothetical protein